MAVRCAPLAAPLALALTLACGDGGSDGAGPTPVPQRDTLSVAAQVMRFRLIDTTIVDSTPAGIADVPSQQAGDCWLDTIIGGTPTLWPQYVLGFPADFTTMLASPGRDTVVYLKRAYAAADTAGYWRLRYLSHATSCACAGADTTRIMSSRIYFTRSADTCQWLFWVHQSTSLRVLSPDMPWRGAYSVDSLLACRRACMPSGTCPGTCQQLGSSDTMYSYRVLLRFTL